MKMRHYMKKSTKIEIHIQASILLVLIATATIIVILEYYS